MASRLWLLAVFFIALMGMFWLRLIDLQIVQGEHLAQAVDQSRLSTEILPPRRGRLLDRHGTAIADNRAVYHLAVTFADLELTGRARREVPIWRLDEQRLDALVADLAVRLPQSPAVLRDILVKELLTYPGVAVRTGNRVKDSTLSLVMVPRRSLAPTGGDGDTDTARLAESDLFTDDPREALANEIAGRWGQHVELVSEVEFIAATSLLDQDFAINNSGNDRSAAVLDPFMPSFHVQFAIDGGTIKEGNLKEGNLKDGIKSGSIKAGSTKNDTGNGIDDEVRVDLHLRVIAPDRRTQAEDVLARLLSETPQLVHERLDRALAATKRPAMHSSVYFAPGSHAETIAPLLPPGLRLPEIPITGVPGARERILLIQGDPPETDGFFSQLQRRLAASLGSDGEWIGSLIQRHGEKLKPIRSERDYRVHQMVIDPLRFDRLANGLANSLTSLGRTTTRLDVDAALTAARSIADRAWEGQTRLDPIAVIRDLPHAVAIRVAGISAAPPLDLRKQYDDTDSPLPGLSIQIDLGREYPFPGSASPIIGLIGHGDDPEGGPVSAWQGKSGLELTYDALLRGSPGKLVRARDPDGVRILHEDKPDAGTDVTTELDMEMQTLSEDSLTHYYELAQALGTATEKMDKARAVGKGRAGFVLIDCHTGGILALVSTPTYSLDDLKNRYKQLNEDPAQPLINNATMPSQPPGSSMKICTALACLEYGKLNPGEEIYSQGYMAKVGDKKILRDHAEPGSYNLPHAIQASSNVYFATIAHRLGGEKLSEFADRFGLGRRNALDVFDQRPGILPKPSTIARVRPKEAKWLPSDDWRFGIGQFATASPLQVVCFAAAVANGGHIVRPYLVRPAGGPETIDLHIRKEYLDEVREGMELVTSNLPHSTAKLLVLEGDAAGIKVAAKTGTSEWGSEASRAAGRTPDHAWMIGYAPADNPTVAFACFVHSGTFGGQACTPIIKKVLERYFSKYGREGHGMAAGE